MMIAQGTEGRKVSGHEKLIAKAEASKNSKKMNFVDQATSSILGKKVAVSQSERKQPTTKSSKPEFGNFSDKVQEAFADKDDIKNINQSFQNARKSVQKALLENPVTNFAKNPLKELQEEMKQVKNAAGTIVKAVTSDTVDFTEPNDTLEKRKFEKLKESLNYIDEGMRRGADRVKKRLKKIFNHPEWYTRYPEFITTNLNYGVRKEAQYFPVSIGTTVKYTLMIPMKDGKVSQAYIDQMHALFQKVRGSNSGAFNYTVEDIAAYIECVRTIYALHTKLVRDIQAINNVDFYVNKTPYALMQVLGYNATAVDAMIAEKSKYVALINQIGNTIYASFPVPPQMAVFDRDHYLSKVILEEGKGPKSSLFAYVLSMATGVDSLTNGHIWSVPVAGDYAAQVTLLQQLIASAHRYLSPVYPNADTFAKIAGDILKAYGQAAFRPIDVADLTSRAAVMFDEYLLHQLQNSNTAAFIGGIASINTSNTAFAVIAQADLAIDGDGSHSVPATEIPIIKGAVGGMIINTNKSDVSGAETLSLTRGNFTLDPGTNTTFDYGTTYTLTVDTVGTDAICYVQAVLYNASNNIIANPYIVSMGSSDLDVPAVMSHWAQVDYMPPVYLYDDSDNNGNRRLIEDLDTYAYMTRDQLAQFNDTCTISLYKTIDISDQVNFRAVKR